MFTVLLAELCFGKINKLFGFLHQNFIQYIQHKLWVSHILFKNYPPSTILYHFFNQKSPICFVTNGILIRFSIQNYFLSIFYTKHFSVQAARVQTFFSFFFEFFPLSWPALVSFFGRPLTPSFLLFRFLHLFFLHIFQKHFSVSLKNHHAKRNFFKKQIWRC